MPDEMGKDNRAGEDHQRKSIAIGLHHEAPDNPGSLVAIAVNDKPADGRLASPA